MNQQDDRLPEPEGDSLDDLFYDAQMAQAMRNPKQKRVADPSVKNALDAAAKKMRELYTLPENWEAKRGIALIDKGTQTLVGNFREYIHRSLPNTRKLIREHLPISIDATEIVEGYMGEAFEARYRGLTWEREVSVCIDIWMDDLMIGCPRVDLNVKTRLGALLRVDLIKDTMFASHSGNTHLQLPSGTNILEQLSTDTRTHLRRQISG